MTELGKMTDEQLKERIQALTTRESIAAFVTMASGAALLLSGFASLGVTVISFAALTLSATCGVKAVFARRRCQEEHTRRHPPPPGQIIRRASPAPEAVPLLPEATKDFNPAAAAVLENDMRSMAPLRLKKKVAEFLPC